MNLDLQKLWLIDRPTAVLVTHSISEAVLLSDRVVVLSSRPGRLTTEVHVDLPRPRTIEMGDTGEFRRYQRQLRLAIEIPP